MGRGSGAAAKTWPKMKMKRGDGVIDRLIPPHAPVTRLIGVAKTEAGMGGGASATRQRPASQVGGLCRVCVCVAALFPSKLPSEASSSRRSWK